jgi:hypothetical protein
MLELMEGLGDGLGLGLVGDGLGLGLVGDGLGLRLVGDGLGLGLVGDGLGLRLLAGLELVTVGPVVKGAQAVGLGLAVVVSPVAGRVDAVATTGCCDAQLAGFGCW